jgi:hypothetical protein
MSFLGSIFSGSKREAERKSRQAQDRANEKAVREFNGLQELRTSWEKEGLEIKKRNDTTIRNFQNQQLYDRYDFDNAKRDYEYDQSMRVFESQLNRFADQRGFNQIAYDQAMRQQNQYMHETLIGMEFDETQTLLNYGAASAGLEFKKDSARATADIQLGRLRDTSYQALDVARSKTAFGKRQANIEALKAGGQLAAIGSVGKSVGKGQQGIKAELGAAKAQMSKQLVQQQRQVMTDMYYNQRDIVNQLLTTEASADLELIKLNAQLDLDQAKMSASRDNLMANDNLVRDRIKAQRLQADLSNVMPLKPEQTPEIPPVREIPQIEYLRVFEPPPREMPAPLPKGPEAYTDWGGIVSGGLSVLGAIATGGMGAASTGGFLWSKGLLSGLGAASGVPKLGNIIPGRSNTIGSNSTSDSNSTIGISPTQYNFDRGAEVTSLLINNPLSSLLNP